MTDCPTTAKTILGILAWACFVVGFILIYVSDGTGPRQGDFSEEVYGLKKAVTYYYAGIAMVVLALVGWWFVDRYFIC